jgi:hypothetical protein
MTTSAQFSTKIDTKKIQREALLILFDNLNDKIDELEEEWITEDIDLYNRMDRVAPDWSYEHIPADNFHPGTLAQLMNRPITEYPNCCTIAYLADPTNSDDDEGEMYRVRLAVELMVKSEKSEQEVNSRIKNVLEAVQAVFLDNYDNRTLNHTISDLGRPRETTGDVFAIMKDNKRWFWQGGSLEYPVFKYTSLYN